MVNWSGMAGTAGVVAGVIVLAGTAQGLLGGYGPSVADEVAAVPSVSAPPAASASAYLCDVSCAPGHAPELSAGEHRARAAYWAGQKVTLPRSGSSAGGRSVSVAAPKQAKAQTAAPKQPKPAKQAAGKAPKAPAAPKQAKQVAPSTTVTVTQKTSTTSKGTTTTSTTTKTTSKG